MRTYSRHHQLLEFKWVLFQSITSQWVAGSRLLPVRSRLLVIALDWFKFRLQFCWEKMRLDMAKNRNRQIHCDHSEPQKRMLRWKLNCHDFLSAIFDAVWPIYRNDERWIRKRHQNALLVYGSVAMIGKFCASHFALAEDIWARCPVISTWLTRASGWCILGACV